MDMIAQRIPFELVRTAPKLSIAEQDKPIWEAQTANGGVQPLQFIEKKALQFQSKIHFWETFSHFAYFFTQAFPAEAAALERYHLWLSSEHHNLNVRGLVHIHDELSFHFLNNRDLVWNPFDLKQTAGLLKEVAQNAIFQPGYKPPAIKHSSPLDKPHGVYHKPTRGNSTPRPSYNNNNTQGNQYRSQQGNRGSFHGPTSHTQGGKSRGRGGACNQGHPNNNKASKYCNKWNLQSCIVNGPCSYRIHACSRCGGTDHDAGQCTNAINQQTSFLKKKKSKTSIICCACMLFLCTSSYVAINN